MVLGGRIVRCVCGDEAAGWWKLVGWSVILALRQLEFIPDRPRGIEFEARVLVGTSGIGTFGITCGIRLLWNSWFEWFLAMNSSGSR